MRQYKYATYNHTNAEICYARFMSFENAREHYFFLKGSIEKLQNICNIWVNDPCNKQMHFEPVSDVIVLKITDCTCHCNEDCTVNTGFCVGAKCRSAQLTDSFDDPIGYLQANSIEFSIFAKNRHGIVHLISPFRYTDNGILMINERELLGFPTTHVHFGSYNQIALGSKKLFNVQDPIKYFESSDEIFQCATLMAFEFPQGNVVMDEYAEGGLNTQPEVQIQLQKRMSNRKLEEAFDEDALSMLARHISKLVDGNLATDLAKVLLEHRHYISMAQLRDIQDGNAAIVQTFFDIHGNNLKLRGFGNIPHSYDFDFNQWLTNSVNEKLKAERDAINLKQNKPLQPIEKTCNHFNVKEALGIENSENIQGCFVDVDFTLSVSRLISQQK